jgi:hypothetical protein
LTASTAYLLSGDAKLDPIQTMMDMATIGPLVTQDASLPPDDTRNLLGSIAHQSSQNVTAVYRWLTGERVYDEYTLRSPSPVQRYMIDYDLDQYANSLESTARSMRNNWTLSTSEVLQTDRAGLVGMQASSARTPGRRDSATPVLRPCRPYGTPT